MKRLAPITLLASMIVLALSATAAPGRERRGLRPTANPGAVVAAELAFAQLAQDKGQWTAFRETATKDAVMFVPQPVNAQAFLKGKANPPVAVRWQPHQVWSSCDGSLAVTRGAWQRPNGVGYFTTVWQRQKDGKYKWVMDQGDDLAQPLIAPDMIAASVADCPGYGVVIEETITGNAKLLNGQSDDGTLYWSVVVNADGSRSLTVQIRRNHEMNTVLDLRVAAPKSAP